MFQLLNTQTMRSSLQGILSRNTAQWINTRSFTSGFPTYPHHEYTQHLPAALLKSSSVIAASAKGSWVFGQDKKKYLDFTSGIGVTNLGHCHPVIAEAVHKQIDLGVHLQQNVVTSPIMLELLPKFKKHLPKKMSENYQVFFSNSGSECVENAVKLARQVTKKQTIIVFRGGFHGRTLGAGSLTTAKWYYRANNQPLMAGVHVVDYPYCYRCPISGCSNGKNSFENCCNITQTQLKNLLKQETSPDEIAAILIEPVLGEGGYVLPPKTFFKPLREFADSIGALLIFDEVQSGFGRTGTMFACNNPEINCEPDIIACAKGLANGFPLSAIISRSEIFAKAKGGSVGGTYSGNAVSCASANKVFDIFEKDNILDNVNQRGKQLKQGLQTLKSKGFPIGDIRGLGLMQAIEFLDSVPVGTANALVKACEQEGMLVVNAGIYESLRFIPPLNITEEDMNIGLQKLEAAMNKVFKK